VVEHIQRVGITFYEKQAGWQRGKVAK